MQPDQWTRSSYCSTGACIRTRLADDGAVQVADSKLGGDSPVLTFGTDQWQAFIDAVKGGGL